MVQEPHTPTQPALNHRGIILFLAPIIYLYDMEWQDYIVSDKDVLLGKPTVKGTRISIEYIVSLLSQGWSEQQILDNYPRLNKEILQAVFVYIYEGIQDGLLYPPSKLAS
jgi:uncharacterized protein (DUF433 family)